MLICLVVTEHAGDACGILVGNVPIAKPLAIANLGGFLERACEGFIPALQWEQTGYLPADIFRDRGDSNIPGKPETVYVWSSLYEVELLENFRKFVLPTYSGAFLFLLNSY